MEPVFKEEALTMAHLLTACRLVFETALSCETLPYTEYGHRTYNITQLNAFIASYKPKVLALFNTVLSSIDTSEIKVPSIDQKRAENPTKPKPPREIFETSLMRTKDLATLIKLVQWQFCEHWEKNNNFEMRLSLGDDGEMMINLNPPEVLRERIERQRLAKKARFTAKANLEWWNEERL